MTYSPSAPAPLVDETILLLMDPGGLEKVFQEHATENDNNNNEQQPYLSSESLGVALRSLGLPQSDSELGKLVQRFDYDHDGRFDQHEFLAALKVPSELEQFLAGLPLLKALARSLQKKQHQTKNEKLEEEKEEDAMDLLDPISALSRMDRSTMKQAVLETVETCTEVLYQSSEKLRQYQEEQQAKKSQQPMDEEEDDEAKYCFKIEGGDLTDFNEGLSHRIGVPNLDVDTELKREHCDDQEMSDEVFCTRNYDIRTTCRIEYNLARTGGMHYQRLFEIQQKDGPNHPDLQGLSDEEVQLIHEGGEPRNGHGPPRVFKTMEEYRQLDVVQTAGLTDAEIQAIVMYTGPLYKPWNTTLRSGTGEFRTSVHVLSSAIKKIQQSGYKLRPGMVLYRGLSGGELPPQIFAPDPHNKNQSGMTEFGIQSTTSDIQVALLYSGVTRGYISTVVETKISQVDSGAFISELSQYPYEKEYVYAPGSYLQAEGDGRMEMTDYGLVKVIPMRINNNGRTQTVEEVMGERHSNVRKTFELVSREIEYELRALDGDPHVLAMDDRNVFPILKIAYVPDHMAGHIQWGRETKQHSLHNTGLLQIILQYYLPNWWKENAENRNPSWFNSDLNYKQILEDIVDLKRQALGVLDFFLDGMSFMIWNALFGPARNSFSLEKLDTMRMEHLKDRLAKLKQQYSGQHNDEYLAGLKNQIQTVARTLCQHEGYLSKSLDELYSEENGTTPLHHEAQGGDATLVQLLMDAGVDLDVKDSQSKYTALMFAARAGHTQIVKLLHEEGGADVNQENGDNMTALMVAAQQGHLSTVEYLVCHTTADPNLKTHQMKQTALILAAQEGHASVCTFLIQKCKADVYAGVQYGQQTKEETMAMVPDEFRGCSFVPETGFELQDNPDSVNRYMAKMMQSQAGEDDSNNSGDRKKNRYKQGDKLAVEFKSDVINLEDLQVITESPTSQMMIESSDQKGENALMFAAGKGHLEVVRVLVEKGEANPQKPAGPTKLTAFLMAAAKGQKEIVEYFLKETNLDLDQPKIDGSTALHHAVKAGSPEVVKLLVDHGASVNKANNAGWTPLMFAAFQGEMEMIKLFIEHGVEVNADTDGVTALACAANGKQTEVVAYLVQEAGANTKQLDTENRSVMDYAGAFDPVVEFLRSQGAFTELDDEDPNTPYQVKISTTSGVWNSFEISFMNSVQYGGLDGVKPLIDMAGKDVVHAICDDGVTALMLAARSGFLSTVQYLVKDGDVDFSMKDKRGRTALDHAQFAKEHKGMEIASMGGDIDAVIQFLESLPATYTGSFDLSKKQKGGMAFDIEYSQRQARQASTPYPMMD